MKSISNFYIWSKTLTIVAMILFTIGRCEQTKLFEDEGNIEFAKILEFKINFKEMETLASNFFIEHSFLSILANVTTDSTECLKKPAVSEL